MQKPIVKVMKKNSGNRKGEDGVNDRAFPFDFYLVTFAIFLFASALSHATVIKSQNGAAYVEMPEEIDQNAAFTASTNGVILKSSPRRQLVETGLSNDEFTEIINGLNENDIVVTRIIQPNSTQTQTQSFSGLRIPGVSANSGRIGR